jgi:hypothetical protein
MQSQVSREDVATATFTMSFIQNVTLTVSVVDGGTTFLNLTNQQVSPLRNAGLPQNLLHDLSEANAIASIVIERDLLNII